MTPGRLLLILLLAAVLAVYAGYSIVRRHDSGRGETFVQVRRGIGTPGIAAELRRAGVLSAEWPFILLRLIRPGSVLQAGEYRFDRPVSPLDAYRKIERGDVFYHAVTIPEGYTRLEIADAVAATGLLSRQEFLLASSRADRVRDVAPQAKTLEGFLFPDTYRLTRLTTADELVDQMTRLFRQVYEELRAARPTASSVWDTVILASLVEEETSVAAERPLVASVFRNRLRIGMPLQCDPTVVYALQLAGRYRGTLYKEDLEVKSPYNTYRRAGLPPGPIANPGRASLQAALAPAETDYLYFVADNKGGHVFSADIDRHSRAVKGYRRANSRGPKTHARRR